MVLFTIQMILHFSNATQRTHDSQLVGNKQTISHASFEGGIGGGCWASRGCWLNLEEVRRREKKHFPTGAAAGNWDSAGSYDGGNQGIFNLWLTDS